MSVDFLSNQIPVLCFCEPWIEGKLRERLSAYKKRYPRFDVVRVLREVETWEPKLQRWSPYMKDENIKDINKSHHKSQRFKSLADSQD